MAHERQLPVAHEEFAQGALNAPEHTPGVSPESLEAIKSMPGEDLGLLIDKLLAGREQTRLQLLQMLASEERIPYAGEDEPDMRAAKAEFIGRAVRALLGPEAAIILREQE